MQVFLLLFLCCILIYTLLYKIYFVQIFLQYKDPSNSVKPQINTSLFLVAIKNESLQIEEFLSNLEVIHNRTQNCCIIIDDYSDDLEYEKTKEIISKFEWVKLIQSKSKKGKKHALRQVFLSYPENNFILLDADCRPISHEWLTQMQSQLNSNDIVLGYGPFFKENSFLNKLIRFEASWIAAQYFGYALRGIPYMGVGRNMAVKSTLYNILDKSIKGKEIQSGDDDMLVQALQKDSNVGIVTTKESFVYSKAESTYTSYLNQKRRHISTSSYYKPVHKALLGGIAICQILFYPVLFISIFYLTTKVWLSLFLIKWLSSWYYFYAISKRLDEHDLKNIGPFMEIIYSFHLIILALSSFARRTVQWK